MIEGDAFQINIKLYSAEYTDTSEYLCIYHTFLTTSVRINSLKMKINYSKISILICENKFVEIVCHLFSFQSLT